MRKILPLLCLALWLAAPARAHFGMIIPSASTVAEQSGAELELKIAFAHPMEQSGMDMEKPQACAVFVNGVSQDIKAALRPATILKHKGWSARYTLTRPGVYQFAVTPAPYFEPAEDKFIIHYTKTAVAAFGGEDGWDKPLGLKAEIVPLTRPFANYAGNVFQGRVLVEGKAAADVPVEVEFLNTGKKRRAPNDYFVTQTVRTDGNGVFTYAAPWAGWWGFAALIEGRDKLAHQGAPRDVELGAVFWTEFTEAGSR